MSSRRVGAALALLLYGTGLVGMAVVEIAPDVASPDWPVAVVAGVTVALGLLVVRRRPDSPTGGALVLLGAAPTTTAALESWARTFPGPLPGAEVLAHVTPGIWVFNLAGFVVLACTYPSGQLPGRRWAALPWSFLAVGVLVTVVIGLQTDQPPGPLDVALLLVAAVALVGVLGLSVCSAVLRARAGGEVVDSQLRWFVLGAGSVPVLLVGGWVGDAVGLPVPVAYTPFMLGIVAVLPGAAAIGVLHHDLLDIDRVLNDTVAGVLTVTIAGGVFALVVTGVAQTSASWLQVGHMAGLVAAAFVTALVLQPLHRFLHLSVGRVIDRDRVVVAAAVRSFVVQVRDGGAEPEHLEEVLRGCLDDPGLLVLLDVPGRDGLTRIDGTAHASHVDEDDPGVVVLEWRNRRVGVLVLDRVSRRRVRRARTAALESRLAIDVSRLRVELRHALDDARASRLRLVEAAAIERRRLERDLHDGAQQQIVAVGMRLRSAQRQLAPDDPVAVDLDIAVASLEATVAGLRRLAHGMRPALLDDGLGPAVRELLVGVPLPVDLQVQEVSLSELGLTTAYFVIAEALANALKHARASAIRVCVSADGPHTRIEVADDGVGGVAGVTSMEDRVVALGGRLLVRSVPGQGTTVTAVL